MKPHHRDDVGKELDTLDEHTTCLRMQTNLRELLCRQLPGLHEQTPADTDLAHIMKQRGKLNALKVMSSHTHALSYVSRVLCDSLRMPSCVWILGLYSRYKGTDCLSVCICQLPIHLERLTSNSKRHHQQRGSRPSGHRYELSHSETKKRENNEACQIDGEILITPNSKKSDSF